MFVEQQPQTEVLNRGSHGPRPHYAMPEASPRRHSAYAPGYAQPYAQPYYPQPQIPPQPVYQQPIYQQPMQQPYYQQQIPHQPVVVPPQQEVHHQFQQMHISPQPQQPVIIAPAGVTVISPVSVSAAGSEELKRSHEKKEKRSMFAMFHFSNDVRFIKPQN